MEYLKRLVVPMNEALKIIENHLREEGKIPTDVSAVHARIEKHGDISVTFVGNKDKRVYIPNDPANVRAGGKFV